VFVELPVFTRAEASVAGRGDLLLVAKRQYCYFVHAYAKNEQADLTREQLKQLARIMKEETHDG
jgi:hypothetical protein